MIPTLALQQNLTTLLTDIEDLGPIVLGETA